MVVVERMVPDELWELFLGLGGSNWLQLMTAAETNIEAVEILAEAGRTKRIRNTARTGLNHRSES
ncbi:hypothetical protein [Streptomyces sp. NPDC001076]